jgi:hypothetical protein
MDHSNNNVDNQCLLNIPIAYILQSKTVQEIEQSFDSNGWNIMHYAVADANTPKIAELIHFSFNYSINGTRNYIPLSVYSSNEKKKPQKVKLLDKIPFCKNGFSPVHLAMFLFHHYNTLSEEFFYQQLAEEYMKVISLFINSETHLESFVDIDGHSLFDYAFLLEDLELIDKLQMVDPSFYSLKKVSAEVGKQIAEVMEIKYKTKGLEQVLNALDKKILNDSLNKDLKINEIIKKPIQKI